MLVTIQILFLMREMCSHYTSPANILYLCPLYRCTSIYAIPPLFGDAEGNQTLISLLDREVHYQSATAPYKFFRGDMGVTLSFATGSQPVPALCSRMSHLKNLIFRLFGAGVARISALDSPLAGIDLAHRRGLEPLASCVTGKRSNQLI